jgi:hypothetical protein
MNSSSSEMLYRVVVENQPTFLEEHIASIFRVEERDKQETSIKEAASFNPVGGGNIFIRNVSGLSKYYTALCPTIQNTSLRGFLPVIYDVISVSNGRMIGER